MFDSAYKFQKVQVSSTLIPDPIQKVYYRFKARARTYFVTIEVFSFGFVAIKYCDIKDRNSKKAYTKEFNDFDAFKVIATCLHIMVDYLKLNQEITFAFYAVPRPEKEHLNKKARFDIYSYAMLNLFPPSKFNRISDKNSSMFVLLNKKQRKPKTSFKQFASYLLDNYDLIFNPE